MVRSFCKYRRTKPSAIADLLRGLWLPFATAVDVFEPEPTRPGRSMMLQCISFGPERSMRRVASLNGASVDIGRLAMFRPFTVISSTPKIRRVAFYERQCSNGGKKKKKKFPRSGNKSYFLNNFLHRFWSKVIALY
jgi:hypothetical protein